MKLTKFLNLKSEQKGDDHGLVEMYPLGIDSHSKLSIPHVVNFLSKIHSNPSMFKIFVSLLNAHPVFRRIENGTTSFTFLDK